MKVLHIVPGVDDIANGMAVVARFLAKEQGEAEVDDLNHGIHRIHGSSAEEVWIHGMWLLKEWLACWRTLRSGKRLVRMPHGSVDPVRLRYHGWKKLLVGPIERWCLRRCAKIVATCEAEKGWIEKYLGKRCPEIEVIDVKRFFKLVSGGVESGGVESGGVGEFGSGGVAKNSQLITHNSQLHLLYLGRQHPLKGLEYLEEAIKSLPSVSSVYSVVQKPELRIVSSAFGEELEKVWHWCDVLVLPTLSENFGLVVAEALERGKRVITTDGAPAWGEGLSRVEHVDRVDVSRKERKERKDDSRVDRVEGGLWSGYEGRLIYLKGYRDGTDEERVELLKKAIDMLKHDGNMV